MQLRSDDAVYLGKMKALIVTLKRKLAKPVALGVHPSPPSAAARGPAWKPIAVQPGTSHPVYLVAPDLATAAMPAGCVAGDVLRCVLIYRYILNEFC